MSGLSFEHDSEVRAAFRVIFSGEGYGPGVLSNAPVMSELLDVLLPGAPGDKDILIAAAEARVGMMLAGQMAQGMDQGTAISLAAAALSKATAYAPGLCECAAAYFAFALRIAPSPGDLRPRPGVTDPVLRAARTAEIDLRMPAARALGAAWDALAARSWQVGRWRVEGTAAPGNGEHVTVTDRGRLGDLAGYLETLDAAVIWEGDVRTPPAMKRWIELRMSVRARELGAGQCAVSAVASVWHIGSWQRNDEAIAARALRDFKRRLRRVGGHRLGWPHRQPASTAAKSR